MSPAGPDASAVPAKVVKQVRKICLALPETNERADEWGHLFNIRRSTYCMLLAPPDPAGRTTPMIVFRPDPEERHALLAAGHPFFGTRGGGRVGMVLGDDTDWTEVRELLTESYRIVAPKKLAALLD